MSEELLLKPDVVAFLQEYLALIKKYRMEITTEGGEELWVQSHPGTGSFWDHTEVYGVASTLYDQSLMDEPPTGEFGRRVEDTVLFADTGRHTVYEIGRDDIRLLPVEKLSDVAVVRWLSA